MVIRNIKIGDKIGPFANEDGFDIEVLDIIEGGMGIVYIGILTKYGVIGAMKTFQDIFINYESVVESFEQEALAWINLERHQNIVNAALFDVVDGRPFILLEFIAPDENNRNTLEHFLNSDLSNSQILDWAIQFCYGMDYAFSKGVSPHRDIKPNNIMITPDKLLKITDFGLAKVWDNQNLNIEKNHTNPNELTPFKNDNGTVMSGTYEW
jgi:serine/threonine protein kinase